MTVQQRHILKSFSAMEVLDMSLPYVKRYFSTTSESSFFFMTQIIQILLFPGMLVSQRSKITV